MTRERDSVPRDRPRASQRLPRALALWWPGLGHLAQRRYRLALVLLVLSAPLAGWTFDANAYEALAACAWRNVSMCFVVGWAGFIAVWGWSVLDVRSLR